MSDRAVDVVVVGPIARDVVLLVGALPPSGGSVKATEMLVAAGGKGANPAVAAARLGARVRLIGVVGQDETGETALAELQGDGIDVSLVARCTSAQTGQIVHLVEPGGQRRYIEHVGANDRLQLSPETMRQVCAAGTLALISTALERMPVAAAVEGARLAGAFIVVDLAGKPATAEAVLDSADLVRGDSGEISVLTGVETHDFATAAKAAASLLERGPRIAVVQAGDEGDLIRTRDREVRLPRLHVRPVDPTGAGDAMVATLAVLLAQGLELEPAGRLAAAAAAHTVGHLGGRPTYSGQIELAAIRDADSVP